MPPASGSGITSALDGITGAPAGIIALPGAKPGGRHLETVSR
jgi:hypothetical protein